VRREPRGSAPEYCSRMRSRPGSPDVGRLAVAVSISRDGMGGLHLRARPVDRRFRLEAPDTTVILTIWCEAPDTLRGRIENLANGSTGYFQGNATLLEFGDDTGLRIASASDENGSRDKKH